MPPSTDPFAPVACALRLGGPDAGLPDPVADLLRTYGLPLVPLPASAPTELDGVRKLTRQARLALIDLDQSTVALKWLKAFRQSCPVLPIVGFYTRATLPDLLAAGSFGLDGALKLPAARETLAPLLAPWLPQLATPSNPPSDEDTDEPLFAPRETSLAATHLSPASDANQALLHIIDNHPQAAHFAVNGPVGSEFSLLARELAARRGIAHSEIAFPGVPPPTRIGLLVTDKLTAFSRSTAPVSLLLRPGAVARKSTLSTTDLVNLSLKPLRSRLPDIAHYLRRWLPDTFAAHGHNRSPFPLAPAWRHAFLAHTWPGEFAEFVRALHRFALLPADQAPPRGFLAMPPLEPSVEFIASTQIPFAYRDRLSLRIPLERLPTVLSALGCPPAPTENE